MKKYRVSTTDVPIFFIEIRSGDKIRSIFFERSHGLLATKPAIWWKYKEMGATGKDSSYGIKPIHTVINVLKFK